MTLRPFAPALALALSAAGCATTQPAVVHEATPIATPLPPATPVPQIPVKAAALAKEPRPATAPVLGRISFVATGDIMAHGEVKKAALEQGGWGALLAKVKPHVEAADIAFGNLETPIAPKADKGSRSFVFNAPPEMLESLRATGFDVVLFSNNHVYDQGREGFAESLDRIDASGLKRLGAGRTREESKTPLRMEVNGVKLAWFGAAQFFNDDKNVEDPKQAHAFKLGGDELAEAIKKVRPEVDAVLVSVHWGVEYQELPRKLEADMAHQWLESGADVVIGSHPHILEPIETYRTQDGRLGLVMYSLGNFISNQSRQYVVHLSPDKVGDTRDAVLVKFALEKRSYGKAGTAVNLADLAYVPLWTDNNHFRDAKERPDIRPVVVDEELAASRKALEEAEAKAGERPDAAQKQALIGLRKRIELLELRRSRIVKRLGEDFDGP